MGVMSIATFFLNHIITEQSTDDTNDCPGDDVPRFMYAAEDADKSETCAKDEKQNAAPWVHIENSHGNHKDGKYVTAWKGMPLGVFF